MIDKHLCSIFHTIKFEFSGFFSSGDMMSQSYSYHKGKKSPKSDVFPLKNGFNLKRVFMSRIILFDPNCISAVSKRRKTFLFWEFSRPFDRKTAATPCLFNFARVLSEYVLRIETKKSQNLGIIGQEVSEWQSWNWWSGLIGLIYHITANFFSPPLCWMLSLPVWWLWTLQGVSIKCVPFIV